MDDREGLRERIRGSVLVARHDVDDDNDNEAITGSFSIDSLIDEYFVFFLLAFEILTFVMFSFSYCFRFLFI